MALVFVDGFDHYNIADVTRKWSAQVTSASNPVPSMDTGRLGSGQSYKTISVNSSYGVNVLTQPYPSALTTGGCGFAFKVNAYATFSTPSGVLKNGFLTVWDGGGNIPHLVLMYNSDGSLSVKRPNGSATLYYSPPLNIVTGGNIPLNTWTYIEFKWTLHATAGTVAVSLNGVPTLSASEVRTFNQLQTGSGSASGLCFLGMSGIEGPYTGGGYHGPIGTALWLDDVYMFDNNTGVTNFLGDVTVNTKLVTDNGTTNNGVASTGDQHSCVDETLADTADYVTVDAVNKIELYQVADLAAGTAIKGVQVTALAKRTTEGSSKITAETRQSGANYAHPTPQGVTTDYAFRPFIYEKDALGATWTDTAFNAMEFGVKKTV